MGSDHRGARLARVTLAWFAFGMVVLLGWHGLHAPGASGQGSSAATDGRFLWQRDCASCHGSDGSGTPWGPDLQGKGPAAVSLAVTSGRMPLAIPAGDAGADPIDAASLQVPRGESSYDRRDTAALVAHSRTILSGPDVPDVAVDPASLPRGAELFQANCAACHTSSGRGGALTDGQVAVSVVPANPTEVVEAMRTGLGTMPVFDRAAIPDDDAAAVATYVHHLAGDDSELGAPLGYIGPVAEGFVAWLVGLLGLLLVVRWIGARS